MTLSFDKQSQLFIAEIVNEQIAERYECSLTVCPRPSCSCRVIQLDLPNINAGDNNPQGTSRYVKIDLFDRSLKPMIKDNALLEELRFAKWFLACLNDEDFELLSKIHFEIKNWQTEEAEPDTIDAFFDYQKIERNGTLSAYNNVLPYADRLYTTIEGRKFRIIDQYCLQPHCLCADVNLSIIDHEESDGSRKELVCIGVNYKTKEWKMVEGGSLSLEPVALYSALENDNPDLYDTLFSRHAKLKSIYAFSKKWHSGSSQTYILPKAGRNDLCPCGSGKKFKKCCSN